MTETPAPARVAHAVGSKTEGQPATATQNRLDGLTKLVARLKGQLAAAEADLAALQASLAPPPAAPVAPATAAKA